MTRPAVGLAAAVCAAIAVGAPGPAAGQSVARDPVVVVGLRPTLGDPPAKTDIGRLSEAQRLREIAGGVIRVVAERPVINHVGLREILGSAYLVDFVECGSEIRCLSRLVAPLTRRTADAVFGDYTVERGTYTFRVRLIDARAARLVHEVQFALRESELEDRKIWRRELAKLFGDEKQAAASTPPATTEGQLPELAPITSEPDPGAAAGDAPAADSAPPADGGSSEAFVDDTALDAISRGVPLHGHFQNYAALGARGRFSRDILVFDNRLQLEFESSISTLRVVGKPQLLFDGLSEEFRLRFREVFAARYYERFDISVGERILTWGVTDFWPVVDIINPRDFSRLANWRPIDEKLPVPAVHSASVFGPFTLHLLAIPLTRNSEFQLDQDAPFALPIPVPGVTIEQPGLPRNLDASGGGAALDIALSSWKLSLYGLWGRNPLPTVYALVEPETMAVSLQVENERVAMGALSLQGNVDAIETIIKAEAAAYARVDDRCEGRDADVDGVPGCFYLRRVPSGRATLGIERSLLSGLDAHLQFISEVTREQDLAPVPDVVDVLAPGFPEQVSYSPIFTLRLQARWLGDDFRPMVFAYWSIADEDFFVNTDLEYHVADGFALALGGFWFQGYAANPDKNRYTLVGSLESSSNAYLRATAWF